MSLKYRCPKCTTVHQLVVNCSCDHSEANGDFTLIQKELEDLKVESARRAKTIVVMNLENQDLKAQLSQANTALQTAQMALAAAKAASATLAAEKTSSAP